MQVRCWKNLKVFITKGMAKMGLCMGSRTSCSSFNMVHKHLYSMKKFFDCSQENWCGKEEFPVSHKGAMRKPGTYDKQSQCYEVFSIHHDLIHEPFDSYLLSAILS